MRLWVGLICVVVVAGVGACSRGVEVESVVFEGRRFGVVVVQVGEKGTGDGDGGGYRVGMSWKRGDGSRYRSLAALRMEREGVVFAMNGGIFDKQFAPVGLYVEEGKELVPLNLGEGEGNFFIKPNGVFWVDESGRAGVVDAREYSEQGGRGAVRFAVQSGPMLVKGGVVNGALDRESKSRRVRNGVGVRGDGAVVFVMSEEPVTFFEMAELFRRRLGCAEALYLDGDLSEMSPPDTGARSEVVTIVWVERK